MCLGFILYFQTTTNYSLKPDNYEAFQIPEIVLKEILHKALKGQKNVHVLDTVIQFFAYTFVYPF